jgi:hypothetical protein
MLRLGNGNHTELSSTTEPMVVSVRAGTERCEDRQDRPDGSRLLDPGSGRNFRRLSVPAPCPFGRRVRCSRCRRHVMLALRQNLLPVTWLSIPAT